MRADALEWSMLPRERVATRVLGGGSASCERVVHHIGGRVQLLTGYVTPQQLRRGPQEGVVRFLRCMRRCNSGRTGPK